MNTKSNKFSNILVNNGGRRDSRRAPSDPYARGNWTGRRQLVVLAPMDRALMGALGRPVA
jgi:hypothetical protein